MDPVYLCALGSNNTNILHIYWTIFQLPVVDDVSREIAKNIFEFLREQYTIPYYLVSYLPDPHPFATKKYKLGRAFIAYYAEPETTNYPHNSPDYSGLIEQYICQQHIDQSDYLTLRYYRKINDYGFRTYKYALRLTAAKIKNTAVRRRLEWVLDWVTWLG